MIAPQNRPVAATVECTLVEFNARAFALHPPVNEDGEPAEPIPAEYVRFTTQGRETQDDGEALAVLNVFSDPLLARDLPHITVTRDYDSLIGYSPRIHLASGTLSLHVDVDLSRYIGSTHGITYQVPSDDPDIVR